MHLILSIFVVCGLMPPMICFPRHLIQDCELQCNLVIIQYCWYAQIWWTSTLFFLVSIGQCIINYDLSIKHIWNVGKATALESQWSLLAQSWTAFCSYFYYFCPFYCFFLLLLHIHPLYIIIYTFSHNWDLFHYYLPSLHIYTVASWTHLRCCCHIECNSEVWYLPFIYIYNYLPFM